MGVPIEVVRADAGRRDRLAELLAAALHDDPISGWVFPDPERRREVQQRFFGVLLDLALADGEVWTTPDEAAVTLWMRVDPQDDSVSPAAAAFDDRMRAALGDHHPRFDRIGQLMDAAHPHHAVHDYLPFVGVRPGVQGRGIGSALLEHRLTVLDADGIPAYLEASSARNAALYRRLGFQPIGSEIRLPDGPALLPMWRG